jgi:hypothetical protein
VVNNAIGLYKNIFGYFQLICFACLPFFKTNKLLLYKTILKPIWTYGIQLWGTASTPNIEILERFQSKVLRMIVDAPWYVPNSLIRRDLSCPTVKEQIRRYNSHYGDRLRTHSNHLAVNLLRLPETDAFAGFCLLICLTDSNEFFFVVILALSYFLVSLVPYRHTRP